MKLDRSKIQMMWDLDLIVSVTSSCGTSQSLGLCQMKGLDKIPGKVPLSYSGP